AQFNVYDDPAVNKSFTDPAANGQVSARLLLGGISCAACTWLIEKALCAVPGVSGARVNLAQSRLDVDYDPATCQPSVLFNTLAQLGYRPQPYRTGAYREQLQRDQRSDLRRLAVAGLGMMQVGMFAIALHAGDMQGIAPEHRSLLRWVSLPVSAFVVLFAARGFFATAWRHLRRGSLVMDLPVALAIGLAFTASAWATITGTGQVYFDSVVMFTFLLLLARFLEQRARLRGALSLDVIEDCLPDAVTVWRNGDWQTIARLNCTRGDRVLVKSGATVPLDGRIVAGDGAVREDAFNGEQLPREVAAGDDVYAGTLNTGQPLQVRASCNPANTRLAALQSSIGAARDGKPRLAQLADKVASWFVGGILLATLVTAVVWLQVEPGRALWVALSVLVISCPCALALATPAALTNAANALRRRGIVVRGENGLDALARISHLVFDKTGTLTEGAFTLRESAGLSHMKPRELRAIASALQQQSNHPLAAAFTDNAAEPGCTDLQQVTGAGVEGRLGNARYRMGSREFCGQIATMPPEPGGDWYWVGLCRDGEALAWFGLADAPRPEAPDAIGRAQAAGLDVQLLTGDASRQGALLAQRLGIKTVLTGRSPQQKMQHIADLQNAGAVVAMVGDGLNDAPVLARADASFAVAGATDLARAEADFVISDGDLGQIARARQHARRCRSVIRQNIAWALAYNLCAIPLAALGLVPPWAAALGMSASSLLVVANSLRLARAN
ncbi:MAG: cadmium-translocating P-type ATPase, partial [Halioglobus sp.]|nr:cadmium-translocating P-type ATPase [Halioglobus sp.]